MAAKMQERQSKFSEHSTYYPKVQLVIQHTWHT